MPGLQRVMFWHTRSEVYVGAMASNWPPMHEDAMVHAASEVAVGAVL